MRKKHFIWQLYPTYLVLILISLLVLAWFTSAALSRLFLERVTLELENSSRIISYQVSAKLDTAHAKFLDILCKQIGQSTGTRVTVILPTGKVLGDSEEDPRIMDNHATRPEIMEALAGHTGHSLRFSKTVHQTMMYAALPLMKDDKVVGIIRTSRHVRDLDKAIHSIQLKIILTFLVVAALAALVGLRVSQKIAQPLQEIQQGARHFAQGDLSYRLPSFKIAEVHSLAQDMNKMAQELQDRIQALAQKKGEQEALLSSMAEAVVAVDHHNHILMVNKAARELFDIGPVDFQSATLPEIIRNPDFGRFVEKTLKSNLPAEDEISLFEKNMVLQGHGTRLSDAQGRDMGALVVLNDITRLKKLETMRQEFVANVSHELKTPITSIKGFVETLREGALADPQEAGRFLDILAKQSDRLNSIVEDLLNLSRIEQESQKDQLPLVNAPVKRVLESAKAVCETKAKEQKVAVKLECPDDLEAGINAPLLEQAVVNLLDNAIKYSGPESRIELEARDTVSEILISVRDRGIGIESAHLPHLFERFYRVDKARSRKLGGTGLGLAIVKHIVQAHKGTVSVESTPGQGSTFFIHLPKTL